MKTINMTAEETLVLLKDAYIYNITESHDGRVVLQYEMKNGFTFFISTALMNDTYYNYRVWGEWVCFYIKELPWVQCYSYESPIL